MLLGQVVDDGDSDEVELMLAEWLLELGGEEVRR